MEPARIYRLNRDRPATTPAAPTTNASLSPQKPKLLDQVRQAIRARYYSIKTEEAYVGWIKRFIFFHPPRAVLAGFCSISRVQHTAQAERSTYTDLISNPIK